MKAGKLSESILKRSVLNQLHKVCPGKEDGPGIGQDYAWMAHERDTAGVYAVSTMPFVYEKSVEMTIHHALNNLFCAMAVPKGILVTVLLPTIASEQELKNIGNQVAALCEREQIQVLGGHTEVLRSVSQTTLCVTALGEADPARKPSCSQIKPGMDILVSKWIGLEGTSILAKTREELLCTRYGRPFIEKAKRFDDFISIRSEAAAAVQSGVVAMHDISEGGIYAALWEMAQCAGVGLDLDLKKIPIRQETVEICEFFGVNPYKLLSGGSVLMAARDGSSVVRALERADLPVAIIGRTTEGNDRTLVCDEEIRYLETPQTDELWKLLGK